jgi:uncharacterized membrane protein YebE (DUF533 family)
MNARHLLDRMLGVGSGPERGAENVSKSNCLGLLTLPAKQRLASLHGSDALAVLGELARRAMDEEDLRSGEPSSAVVGGTAPLPDEARARVLLKALIAAAKVDGRINVLQQSALAGADADVSGDERVFLQEQMERDPMLDDVARGLTTRAETIEVYAASLLAIDRSRPLSRHYLDMLAARLGIERALVERIEHAVAADA